MSTKELQFQFPSFSLLRQDLTVCVPQAPKDAPAPASHLLGLMSVQLYLLLGFLRLAEMTNMTEHVH